MVNLAICEDKNIILEEIKTIIMDNFSDIIVYSFKDLESLDKKRDQIEFDIYLLDIDLGNENGFEYANSIRQTNKNCKIGFITCHDEYSIQGYKLNANGYILKPFSESDITDLLFKFLDELNSPKKFLILVENYQSIPILVEEINFIKVENRKTYVFTDNDQIETNEPLNSILKKINLGCMLRINRSLAVNVNNIKRILPKEDKYIILFKQTELKVSKASFISIINHMDEYNNA